LRKLLAIEWMPSCTINVNFPDRDPEEVEGTMVTVQGRRDPGLLQIDERHDTWGNPYYWLAFGRRRSSAAKGTDLAAVYAGYISVTPLFLDLTYQTMRDRVERALG
jgi:5'-nucleotidase